MSTTCTRESHAATKGPDLASFLAAFEYKGVQDFGEDCLVLGNCHLCHSTVAFEVNTPGPEIEMLIETGTASSRGPREMAP